MKNQKFLNRESVMIQIFNSIEKQQLVNLPTVKSQFTLNFNELPMVKNDNSTCNEVF